MSDEKTETPAVRHPPTCQCESCLAHRSARRKSMWASVLHWKNNPPTNGRLIGGKACRPDRIPMESAAEDNADGISTTSPGAAGALARVVVAQGAEIERLREPLAPTPEQARHNQYVVAFAEWLRRHDADVPMHVLAAEIEEEGSPALAEIVAGLAPNWLARAETQDAIVKAAVAAERARCAAVCRAVGLSWQGDDDDLESAAARMALSEAREFIGDGRDAVDVPRTGGA